MEGTGIVAVIALVLNLIYFFVKRKDSPEAVRKRILEGAKDDLESMDNALARGDPDDATTIWRRLRNNILRESAGDPTRRTDKED